MAVRLMSIGSALLLMLLRPQWQKQRRALADVVVSERRSAAALWASWRADLFPPDCPLRHSNVRSSWVTSPTPNHPPTHPSLSLFGSVLPL